MHLKYWLLYFLQFYACYAVAQQPVFRHYTVEDGLPSSEVYCVIQDSKGYMWFGTDRGIVKFDGYNFRTISTAEGLSDNTVFLLYEDMDGKIWHQPFSSKMGYLHNDTPFTYRYNNIVRSFLKGGVMNGLIVQDEYDVWLCAKVPLDTMTSIIYIDDSGKVDTSVNNIETRDIYMSADGKLCISTGRLNAKIVRVRSLETKKVLFTLPGSTKTDYDVLSCKRGGTTWLYDGTKLLMLKDNKCRELAVCKEEVLSVSIDQEDNLWVGYIHKGLEMYEAKTGYNKKRSFLLNYSITGITCDREGGLWFTTLENGVHYLPPHFTYSYGLESGLQQPKVMKMRNINGVPVMILPDGSLAVKYAEDEKPIVIHQGSSGVVNDIYYDTATEKTFILHGGTVKLPFNYVIKIKNNKGIYVDKKKVWSYGVSFSGHHLNGKFLGDNLLTERITCLLAKENDDLFVGTVEGLWEFKNNGTFRSLKEYHPLLNSRISGIKRLDSKHVAIATIGQGLLIVYGNDYAHPVQLSLKNGLPGVMCHTVLCDGTTVWVGTNKGLCKIDNILDSARRKISVIDNRNGLISNEVNDICIIGNELWIATMKGVSVLPRTFSGNKIVPIPLYIEQVQVNGRNVNMTEPASFSYDQNNVNISFTGLNYQHAGNLQYKYRLKGIDNKWNTTINRSIIYNALPPGDYVFEFKAIGPNQQESTEAKAYSFTIHPPFWSTWWFRTLAGILLASGIYALVFIRVRTVKKRAQIKNDLNKFREQALRAQMNPHFIYNSMNAIQNFIRKNDVKQSTDLLGRFSSLMRLTFNNSGAELVTLEKDLQALRLYVEMESIRFPGKFTFHISVDKQIDTSKILIPPLLMQPFVENAILHAFVNKTEPGNIWLEIHEEEQRIRISVKDDGIGREKALLIKKRKDKYLPDTKRKDSGVTVTAARIEQVWNKKAFAGMFETTDMLNEDNSASGTLVVFYLPLVYDQSYTR